MSSSQTIIWLPVQPLDSQAAELPELNYQIKTLVVSAQATVSSRKGVVRVQASVKIPFKASFTYRCDVQPRDAQTRAGWQFSGLKESHGDGFREGVVTENGLELDGKQIAAPLGLKTVLMLAQAPYVLRGAGDFEQAYLGLLVGRHPHLVRFNRVSPGIYKISALGLKHDDVISDDPSRLEWSRAHGAEIKVRDGFIDEIRVTIPLMGAVTIRKI